MIYSAQLIILKMEEYEEKFKGKNILVAGGLGFIGSNLVRKLVELKPGKILIVDSLVKNLGGNPKNVEDVSDSLQIYNWDISNYDAIAHLLKEQKVSYIFNLAGSGSHIDSKDRPMNDLELNLRGPLSLLENCRQYVERNKVAKLKILFSSTRDVYGKVRMEDLPIKEGSFIWKESDPQGIHKHSAEFHHRWYGTNFGLETTVLRLTNTYGPRQKIEDQNLGFLGYFIHQALTDETIQLWDGGEALRDFNFVDDVVEAMLRTMASEKTSGEIYNLGSFMRINGRLREIGGNIKTVGESAKSIVEIAGTGKIEVIAYPEERKAIEPGHVYLDATKIHDSVGWVPRTSFEEGVRKTIEFYRNREEYKK